MGNKPLDINTLSEIDVLETLRTAEQWGLKPEVMDVVYDFASELTGKSVDQLNEWLTQ